MRRRALVGDAVPPRLARFDVDRWVPGQPWPAFTAWCQAREAWVAAGNEWPGGPVAMSEQQSTVACRLPDEPFMPESGHFGRDFRRSEWF